MRTKYLRLWYWKWRYSLLPMKFRRFLRRRFPAFFQWYRFWTFNLYAEYGTSFPISSYKNNEKFKPMLKNHMDLFIPSEFQHRVEYRAKTPMDYGRRKGLCWYYRLTNIGKTRPIGYYDGYWVI